MAKITITEALSELNLIKKKIEKKKPDVLNNLVRFDHMADPFANVGGSKEYIGSQLQAIDDLRKRFVKIRSAIAQANTVNTIKIGRHEMTINEWLNWKREQSKDEKEFHESIAKTLKVHIDNAAQRPSVFKDDQGNTKLANMIPNVEYSERLKAVEEISDMIENLDGQLSLKNATITIEI